MRDREENPSTSGRDASSPAHGSAGLPVHRVRLAPGTHATPRDGVCVVELASLIAGEDFSDRPGCVCPVIASFLRAWNDRAAHADRQLLKPVAGRIVGSRSGRAITRRRRQVCLDWAAEELGRGSGHGVVGRLAMRARIAVFVGLPEALRLDEGAGEYAARLAFARRDADAAFAVLECLLSIRERGAAPAVELRLPGEAQAGARGDSPDAVAAEAKRSAAAPGEILDAEGEPPACDEDGRRVRRPWLRLRPRLRHLRRRRSRNPARVAPRPAAESEGAGAPARAAGSGRDADTGSKR